METSQKHHIDQGEDARSIEQSKRQKAIVKETRKAFGKYLLQKKLCTKEGPHNNHTFEDKGQSWDLDAD